MKHRLGPPNDRAFLAALLLLAIAASAPAPAPAHSTPKDRGEEAAELACSSRREPVRCFAALMRAGRWSDAWAVLSDVDRAVLPRDVWVARYDALVKLPWIAAVLRSARWRDGRLVAVDWTHTRYASAAVLADMSLTAALPTRTYAVQVHGDKVLLGLGALETATRTAARAQGASVIVGGGEGDYFVRAASLRARCGPGQRFLLVRVTGLGVDERLCLDCSAAGKPDEPPLWATEIDSKMIRRMALRADVETATPRRLPHPFAAPPPELASHPALPILP